MQRPADHPEIPPRRIGVILVNLGTPDAPTPAAVRGYLKQFLSDRRVVEISPWIWQQILRGIILNTRPHFVNPSVLAHPSPGMFQPSR